MNGRKQCATQDTCNTHHMEWVQGPVVESLKEEEESEDSGDPKRWSEKPTRLTQRVDEKDANKNSDRTRERNSIVGTDTDETCQFKLAKHESNQSESASATKAPESPKLTPPDEIPLILRTPEKQKRMTHRICWSRNCRSKKVCTLQIGTCQPVSIPTRDESSPSSSTANSKISSGKKKKSRPANKNKTISFSPVVKDIEPSPLWRTEC